MYDKASELYNELLETYFDEYYDLWDAERKKMEIKYKPKTLFLKEYSYNDWFENEELINKEESVDLYDMPPLEDDDEEVKGGK